MATGRKYTKRRLPDGRVICSGCKQPLPRHLFYIDKHGLVSSKCIKCSAAYGSALSRKKLYGLNDEALQSMLAAQSGLCLVCRREITGKFCVDHCHHTGEIRGLLCRSCNMALGALGENPSTVARALSYLYKELSMNGLFFAHISPDPKTPGRALIKIGTVKVAVGVGRWLLQFEGRNYNFSNVFSAENLEGFAFFNTVEDRKAFIADLLAQNTLPQEPVAPVTEASPESASVQ